MSVKNMTHEGEASNSFPRDAAGSPEAKMTETLTLNSGDTFELRAEMICKSIGNAKVKMYGYNASVPGPTLKVKQGSEITVNFTNALDLETTVHWHGLRLDNRFDGVPEGSKHQGMQAPISVGDTFSYRLRFPDPGMYWYHPHIREDYTQELGLYGNILVVPNDPHYWSPVNREYALMLDDILIEDGKIAAFSQTTSTHTAMGRFGNIMLVNGETSITLTAKKGEVVRLYLTNAANVRIFNLRIPGTQLKLVGGDSGRIERETFVDEVMLAPSERAIVEVFFPEAGTFKLKHHTPDKTYPLGTIKVSDEAIETSCQETFETLRHNTEFIDERTKLVIDVEREPDKTLTLIGEMSGMNHNDHQHDTHQHNAHQHGTHRVESIEWEDTMNAHNRVTTPETLHWKIVNQEGTANHDIQWTFKQGERIKVRIVNTLHSDHPMQHPMHFHGQRFLILKRDGVPNDNLAWKDTVLLRAGETVDILVDMSNRGTWMAHCHIAEHSEGGMMFHFDVE
jgi:FtsP/CotA-like multicopper oxidase with cupredoxin domain